MGRSDDTANGRDGGCAPSTLRRRLKVLLFSYPFHPATGGVETVSLMLAEGLARRGMACTLVTQTPSAEADDFAFAIVRQPHRARERELIAWADVVLFNGASLALQPWLLLSRKPFVWVHVGYQTLCIDGLGWADGKPAPLTPLASVRFHARRSGVRRAAIDGAKLLLRRLVARHAVTRNVAITQWMDRAQPMPDQVQIYNPFPLARFRASTAPARPEFDFVYVGRMVSEKGLDTLIHAMALVVNRAKTRPRLLAIGDGATLPDMMALARQLGVGRDIHFVGRQTGTALADWVVKGHIGVVPSTWFEPMGGVALEMMAAGLGLIVSEQGGLAECVGDAGLLFPNGKAQALADCMLRVVEEPALRRSLRAHAQPQAEKFAPDRLIDQYVELLHDVAAPG